MSAHFVVGLEGEVIQCVPLDEQSSASNDRNPDTISIEVCHPDSSGKFNDKTYGALVKLTAWLCDEFHLDEKDVIRHYDITGKNCPKYFVEHPKAWEPVSYTHLQVVPEEARKTGIDEGFGRDSHGIDVATFLAEEAMRRRGEL